MPGFNITPQKSFPPAYLDPANAESIALWADMRGEVFGSSVEVDENGVVLPNNPCRYVMLMNWNSDESSSLTYLPVSADGLYENTNSEFYYGFRGVYVAQLYPSQSSGLLPVRNTNLICVRTRPGITRRLFFAWFY